MGICYNNIGNIHRARQEFEKAEELYSKAIEFGVMLNDPPTIESQRALSSRYNNLAMLYIFRPNNATYAGGYVKRKKGEERNFQIVKYINTNNVCRKDYNSEAERLLLKALELDNATLDYLGMISHYGNLALLCMKQEMPERAAEYMRQVFYSLPPNHLVIVITNNDLNTD
jgi:tetratricopeptide (TPR) repeat protein